MELASTKGLLPVEIENKLAAYTLLKDDNVEDRSCWGGTSNGRFTVKSVCDMINNPIDQGNEFMWKDIWKLKVPNRIRSCIWLVSHKKIMSNNVRVKRGFTTDSRALCLKDNEDVDHIFRKCNKVRGIWCELDSKSKNHAKWRLNFDEWLMENLSTDRQADSIADWISMFAIAVWWIWKWRNDYVFRNNKMEVRLKIKWIKEQHWDIRAAFSSKNVMSNYMNSYEDRSIKWIPPPKEWCALNVDGCVKLQGQRAGGGGLLRNEYGEWIKGFIHNIGVCTSEEA